MNEQGGLQHHQTLTLGGNVLDVGVGPALWEIVVSIDNVHRPGSMHLVKPEESPTNEDFETFELFSNGGGSETSLATVSAGRELRWERSSLAMMLNAAASSSKRPDLPKLTPPKQNSVYSNIGEVMYGLENLRKRRGQDEANGDDEGSLAPEEADPPA